ncbi:protein kinase [bacterium]|nr:protein kinase [bacterium]
MLSEPEQAVRALVRQGAVRSQDAAACLYEAASSGESALEVAVRRGLVSRDAASRALAQVRAQASGVSSPLAGTLPVDVPFVMSSKSPIPPTIAPDSNGPSGRAKVLSPIPPTIAPDGPRPSPSPSARLAHSQGPGTSRITKPAARAPTPPLGNTQTPVEQGGDSDRLPFGLSSSRFGHYELVRRLGEGGMGVVYEARDRKLGRTVALKMLSPERRASELTLRRFEREARAAAKLRHANIVPIFETGEFDKIPYMTMDMVKGPSLAALIAEAGKGMHWRRACEVMRDAARGIAHAHDMGIVHRDVKPSNILVDEEGRGHVVDFGLARDMDERPDKLTKTGQLVGTPLYMAPERFDHGTSATGPLVDVYSLGATLYEAVSREVPYTAGSVYSLVAEIKKGAFRPPRMRAGTPGGVALVCERALAREPERRYLNAALMADDLDRVLAGRPLAGGSASLLAPLMRTASEHRAIVGAVALVLVLVPVALVFALGERTASSQNPGGGGPPPPATFDATPPPPLYTAPPKTAEEAIERARARIWTGDLLGARAIYAEALRMAPSNADAGFEDYVVGTFLDLPGAGTSWQELLGSHPKHPIALVIADAVKAQTGTAPDPEAVEAAIARSPVGPLLRAFHSQSTDLASSLKELKRALEERPRCGLIACDYALALVDARKPEDALKLLAEERDYEGVSASLREAARGRTYEAQRRWEQADASYAKVVAPATKVVDARGRRALIAIARSDFAGAIAFHGGREPGSIEDRIALARCLLALEKKEEARTVLDLAVEISEQGGDMLGILRAAGGHENDKRFVQGVSFVLPGTPHDAEARGRRARLAARMGDLKTAQDDTEKFGDGASGERRATKATIALVKGNAEAAEKLFSKAFDNEDPPAADALLDRALALEKLGDVSGATTALKNAIAADPALGAEARARLVRLERK